MSNQPEKEQEPTPKFQRFDSFMRKLARVPVSEVRELESEQKRVKVKRVGRDRNPGNSKTKND